MGTTLESFQMEDCQIEELIDELNAKRTASRIFLSPISTQVDFGKVWLNDPEYGAADNTPYTFFFIKNDAGAYVAAVLDMTNDLHAFVKFEHRRQGHLRNAMSLAILPKLKQLGRETQCVTFRDSRVREYCKRNLNLSYFGDLCGTLDISMLSERPMSEIPKSGLSRDGLSHIRARLELAKTCLVMTKVQLESVFGESEEIDIDSLIADVAGLNAQVEDLMAERDIVS